MLWCLGVKYELLILALTNQGTFARGAATRVDWTLAGMSLTRAVSNADSVAIMLIEARYTGLMQALDGMQAESLERRRR